MFPKNRMNRIAAVKSSRLLKKAQHLFKSKTKQNKTKKPPLSPNQQYTPKPGESPQTSHLWRVQLDTQQDDSRCHVARNRPVSKASREITFSSQRMPDPGKKKPVWAKPHREAQPAGAPWRVSLHPVPPQVWTGRGGQSPASRRKDFQADRCANWKRRSRR